MTDLLHDRQQSLLHWAQQATAAQWLPDDAMMTLNQAIIDTPGALFESGDRPLVVGLFGGTGVGKSTLLNRLADEPIARASAERPTSRDITLYVHESVTVSRLPADFPTSRVHTAIHQSEHYRNVLWIDMPDVDSAEQRHRELVERWLPHIDVVIYVVSPERYRDDTGWRMLLEHGHRHAWQFVINHWDHGDPRQLADFTRLLGLAGLADPLVFCTDCSQQTDNSSAGGSDDFQSLSETITHLSTGQLVAQLEARGVLQRLKQLRTIGGEWRHRLGATNDWQQFREDWPAHWAQTRAALRKSAGPRISLLAAHHAETTGSWISGLWRRRAAQEEAIRAPESPRQTTAAVLPADSSVIDPGVTGRIDACLDEFMHKGQIQGLPTAPLASRLEVRRERLVEEARQQVLDAMHAAMTAPGTAMQRAVHRGLGWLTTVLPVAALCWVGFRIITGFWNGGYEPDNYLGSNFAIHSALLVGMAWLVPVVMHHKLKPSREQAAAAGLSVGLQQGLDTLGDGVQLALDEVLSERQRLLEHYDSLWRHGHSVDTARLPASFQRLLFDEEANTEALLTGTSASSAVRATTHSSTDSAPVS